MASDGCIRGWSGAGGARPSGAGSELQKRMGSFSNDVRLAKEWLKIFFNHEWKTSECRWLAPDSLSVAAISFALEVDSPSPVPC
eukprot:gene5144-34952_t